MDRLSGWVAICGPISVGCRMYSSGNRLPLLLPALGIAQLSWGFS